MQLENATLRLEPPSQTIPRILFPNHPSHFFPDSISHVIQAVSTSNDPRITHMNCIPISPTSVHQFRNSQHISMDPASWTSQGSAQREARC